MGKVCYIKYFFFYIYFLESKQNVLTAGGTVLVDGLPLPLQEAGNVAAPKYAYVIKKNNLLFFLIKFLEPN